MPKLLSFEELHFGEEVCILPAIKDVARTEYVHFPTSSENLKPYFVQKLEVEVARFSVFKFDDLRLSGFRLFSNNGLLFTDQSLVDNKRHASEIFFKKRETRQLEDVIFDIDGSPRSKGEKELCFDAKHALALCSDEPSNFGSWIYRILPKFILAYEETGIEQVFVYQNSKWMLPILKLVCPTVEVIPHWPEVSYTIKNLNVPSLPAPDVWFRKELHERLYNLVDKITAENDSAKISVPERIYISRRKQAIARPSFRILENETELVETLLAHGFFEFFPEDYSIKQQIEIISKAKIIISVGGSNLFGCIFAKSAELIIDIESSTDWLFAHTNLLASTCRPFSIVQGVRNDRGGEVHGNWTIDVASLIHGIRLLGAL